MSAHEGHKKGSKSAGEDQRQLRDAEAVPAQVEDSTEHASAQQPPAGVQSVEPQNAHMTGASASLQRELLGQNAATNRKAGREPQAQPAVDTPVGQHATGSNVDVSNRK